MNSRLVLVWFTLAATLLAAAEDRKPDLDGLASFIRSEQQRQSVPGCAVAVVLGDQALFTEGFGVVNVDTGGPVGPDTLFRLGSTTKMFTAATLVSLAEESKLKLDAPISEYVSGLNPKLGRLTTHQLLTHTAGLADETKMEGPHDEKALGEALRARDDDLCFAEPATIWSYSNPGYWLAGLVIEEVSGKYYANAVQERVLAPAGMKRSTFRPIEAMTWPVAIGHGPEGRGAPFVIRPLADNAAGWPAGQLFSSAREFARFCIAFLNGGKLEGKQVLAASLIEKLSTPHASIPGRERHYGYGLGVEDEEGVRWLSHTGSRTGYGSLVKMCPSKKFAVIILCNKTGERLPRVADKAAQLVLGISGAERPERQQPLACSEEELQRYAGVYSNGKTTVRLIVREGKLVGPPGAEMECVGEHRFLRHGGIAGPETEMLFIPGADGRIEYLYRGSRALKRME